jgi:hypothetical protein
MYTAYTVNTVINNAIDDKDQEKLDIIYSAHYSIFDTILSQCPVTLYAGGENAKKVFRNNTEIYTVYQEDVYIRPYNNLIANNTIKYVNEGHAYNLHLNAVIFCHDYDLRNIKAEERTLVCNKGFRESDLILSFNNSPESLNCEQLNYLRVNYSIPEIFNISNKNKREKIGVLSYNKDLSNDLVTSIHQNSETLSSIPNIESLAQELNEYRVLVELDPNSIINIMVGVCCGCIGIIHDPHGVLTEYSDFPNLYIAKSIAEIQELLEKDIEYKDNKIDDKYRNFENFSNSVYNVLTENKKRAFRI